MTKPSIFMLHCCLPPIIGVAASSRAQVSHIYFSQIVCPFWITGSFQPCDQRAP